MQQSLKSKSSLLKQDVFDLGLLLLISALGGIDILDHSEFERISKKTTDTCCVLHCSNKGSPKNENLTLIKYFTKNRYSDEFLDFLCCCLRFSEESRPSLNELQNHPWMNSKSIPKSAVVSLKELIQISNQWRQIVPVECQGPAEKQLERICEAMIAVLPCCSNFEETIDTLLTNKESVRELALDLGLELDKVWNKLKEVIKAIKGKP